MESFLDLSIFSDSFIKGVKKKIIQYKKLHFKKLKNIIKSQKVKKESKRRRIIHQK